MKERMEKENVVIVSYKVESEAYQALSELRREPVTENYRISQAVLVKRENGAVIAHETFDSGAQTADDAMIGGLAGALVGVLGGPIGVLLGGSMGAAIGSAVDLGDAVDSATLLERAGECIAEGETALLLLVQEQFETPLEAKLNKFDVSVTRFDAAELAVEVERARAVERQVAKETRAKLRAEKTEGFKKTVEEKRGELKKWFEGLK